MLLCNPGKPLKRKILIHGFDFDRSTSFLETPVFFFTAHHRKEPFRKMLGNNTANGTYNILHVFNINIVFMDALKMQ